MRPHFSLLFPALVTVHLTAAAAGAQTLSGAWTLNPALTQGPQEVGFNTSFMTPPTGPQMRDREGGGGAERVTMPRPESADDATRKSMLTDEVRQAPGQLTIADTQAEIVFTDDRGQSRKFHPNGSQELIDVGGVPVNVTAQRTGPQLTVVYEVENGRQLRYTFNRNASPPQLVVDIEFVGKGGGDKVRHVYEPTKATPPQAASTSTAAGQAPPPAVHPGDEFKNLTTVGVVVEELSSQALSCGLTQSALQSALSKRLTEGGLKVRKYADEAPYLYVQILTTSLSNGLCVSRYDASLLTHSMATLSYQQTPVLVEVSLLHDGGITGGSPAAHAENVTHGLLGYVDQFVQRIKDANK